MRVTQPGLSLSVCMGTSGAVRLRRGWSAAGAQPRVVSAVWDDPCVMEMSAEAFEQLVTDELDLLPDEMVDGLDNVVFVVEDEPENGEELFGVYDGIAATERGQYGFGELPDRIVVFRKQHLAECDTVEELKDEVHTTLVHEIGHFYGIDDERLHELGWA